MTRELFSYGEEPYIGCSNAEASEKVLSGYRLPKPDICPPQIFALICQCWSENPKERPPMKIVHERLTKEHKKSVKIVASQRKSEDEIIYHL